MLAPSPIVMSGASSVILPESPIETAFHWFCPAATQRIDSVAPSASMMLFLARIVKPVPVAITKPRRVMSSAVIVVGPAGGSTSSVAPSTYRSAGAPGVPASVVFSST